MKKRTRESVADSQTKTLLQLMGAALDFAKMHTDPRPGHHWYDKQVQNLVAAARKHTRSTRP